MTADSRGGACELVVHLGAGYGTAGLLKVLSLLHSRGVDVDRLDFSPGPDRTSVAVVSCRLGVTGLESVRRKVAGAVPVTAVRARALPTGRPLDRGDREHGNEEAAPRRASVSTCRRRGPRRGP